MPIVCRDNVVPDITVEANLVPDNMEPVPVALPSLQFDPQMAVVFFLGFSCYVTLIWLCRPNFF